MDGIRNVQRGKNGNQELLDQLDEYIDLIGRAQLKDGYISTKQILGERQNNGIARLGDINDFEVYNFGHLFTAACLYKRITGKENFLDIAKKAAAYLDQMYQENARNGEVQTAVCPSHYMGLIEMYRTTGDKKYLELAKLAITLRDSVKDGTDDNQDRIPLKQHDKILGHAVRSNYLYAGVADLYAETGEAEYKDMLDKVWRNLIDKSSILPEAAVPSITEPHLMATSSSTRKSIRLTDMNTSFPMLPHIMRLALRSEVFSGLIVCSSQIRKLNILILLNAPC